MARINIEEKLFADARFVALCNKISRREAMGMMIDAWFLAQRHWLTEHKYIPEEEFLLMGLQPLADCLFAKKIGDGYYMRGSEEQFDWLKNKQLAGKKSAEIRKNKFGSAQPQKVAKSRTDAEQCSEEPRTATEPLTLTLTLNTNTYTSNKPSVHKGDSADEKESMADAIVKVWNQTLTGTLPPVSRLTDKRKKFLNAQLKKYPDLDHWQQVCEKVKASDFLTGKTTQWKCGFDWMLNENNRTKILEGNYDNKTQPTQEPERRWLEIPERGDE